MTKENEVLEVQPVKLEAVDPKNEKHHIKGNIAYRVLKSLEFFDLSEFCDNVILVKSRRGWTGENPKTMVAVFVYAVTRGVFCSRIIASQTQWEPGFRSILGDGPFLEEGEITSFIEET